MAVGKKKKRGLPIIGWREWVALPELGIPGIKAKIDTGARSSALHATNLERFERGGVPRIRFRVHPLQKEGPTIVAEAVVIGERRVRNPGGRTETRPVIRTPLVLYGRVWDIELTLTPRWEMGFRMLLGRQAVRRRFVIDAGRSFLGGAPDVSSPRRKKKRRGKEKRLGKKKRLDDKTRRKTKKVRERVEKNAGPDEESRNTRH